MGFRFRKSVKIAPGVRLNVGSKSVGISAGVKGARVSTNTRTGTRATVSAPGTGLSYSTKIGGTTRSSTSTSAAQSALITVDPNATIVQLSANTITWPCLCPCCGVRFEAPTGSKEIASGVYAVNMAVKSFAPSYCQRCLNHQGAWQQANSLPGAPDMTVFWVITVPVILFFWLIGFVALASATGLGAGFVGSVTIAGLIGYVAKQGVAQNIAKLQAENDAQRNILVQQANTMKKPECTCLGPAVALVGSHGSTRRFAFANPKLAAIFSQLNAKKVIH